MINYSESMEFEEFVRQVDAAVRAGTSVDRFAGERPNAAAWTAGSRGADVALVPPRNVSVTLTGASANADTTWYPIDAALVPVVSQRIAGHLRES